MSGNAFDWADVEHLAVSEQPAVAIYRNPQGAVVIRQAGQFGPEEDHWIFIHRQNVLAVCFELLDQLDGAYAIAERVKGGWCDIERPPRPADLADKPEPETEPERLALPAPDHKREAVAPDLFREAPHGRA